MSEKQPDKTATEKAGGRKAMAFYATLACCLLLALLDKAKAEVLGLIDTLFLVYAGSNVLSKRPVKTQTNKPAGTVEEGKA
tara:strand:+ start:1453 stop:1695 length:243 start_codon:yes stop_codon:yes gene_type:complete